MVFQKKLQRKLQYAAISHPGLVRRNNEDNLWMNGSYKESAAQGEYESHNSCTDQRALFAVCDGMGGEAYGEQASLLAVESLHQSTMENAKEDSLRDILQAHKKLCQWMDANGGDPHMARSSQAHTVYRDLSGGNASGALLQ